MFQNHIVATGTTQWSATPVFGVCGRWLPASNDRVAAVSRPQPVLCTDGQSVMFTVWFVIIMLWYY